MKLSIITINYNNREGLEKTINSIIAQTWKDYEWIIIDGGSTDGSKELIEQYEPYFTYWCSEPDNGPYNAMNKGILHANGEYLNFMNSGDTFFHSKTLEEVYNYTFNEDIVYGDWIRIEKEGEVLKRAPNRLSLDFLYSDNICHQASFVKTSVMKTYGFDEAFKVYADWNLWIKMILGDCSSRYMPLTICRFDAKCGLSNRDFEYLELEKKKVSNTIPSSIREVIISKQQLSERLERYEKHFAVRDTYSLSNESRLYSKLIRINLEIIKSIKRVATILNK